MSPRPLAWSVSEHAAERYCQRVDPRLAPSGAVILLRQLLPQATLLPEPTLSGQQRWLLPSGNAVVVARPDPKIRAHIAVTVLGPHEMYDVDAVDDVVEAFRRASSPVSEPTPMPPAKVRVVEVGSAHAPLRQQLREALDRATSAERETERIRRHAETQEQAQSLMRAMLREAVIALRGAAIVSHEARDGLARLEAMRPGITGDAFCYPERFTKEERRAATRAAEEQRGAA